MQIIRLRFSKMFMVNFFLNNGFYLCLLFSNMNFVKSNNNSQEILDIVRNLAIQMNQMNQQLNQRVEEITISLNQTNQQLNQTNQRVEEITISLNQTNQRVEEITKLLKKGLTDFHNFGRDRINVIKSVTHPLSFPDINCSGTATRHSFYLNGKVGELFTPHFNCSKANASSKQFLHDYILTSPHFDLGIIPQCPKTKFALNISYYTVPKQGDDVVSFAFGSVSRVFKGCVSLTNDDETCPSVKENLEHWLLLLLLLLL